MGATMWGKPVVADQTLRLTTRIWSDTSDKHSIRIIFEFTCKQKLVKVELIKILLKVLISEWLPTIMLLF